MQEDVQCDELQGYYCYYSAYLGLKVNYIKTFIQVKSYKLKQQFNIKNKITRHFKTFKCSLFGNVLLNN